MNTKERARIYARVSSDRQRKENTITNQIGPNGLPKDIARLGMELTGIYTDDGKSASAGKLHLRGDFNKALHDASKKEYDVLFVADLDRITRSNDWGELGQIFGPLQKAGIKLAGPNLAPMELGNTMNMVQIMMRIMVAYEDNQKRVERFMIGKKEAARRGCHVQGPVPYGLTWRMGARDSSGWGTNEDQARLVRELFQRVLAGESGHQVARAFEERGEKAPRGGRWFEPISRFLKSPVYRGETSYYGIPVKVPALVSEDDWYRVQALLAVSKKRGLEQTRHEHLASGLGVCSLCSSPIYVRPAENKIFYYVCRDRCDTRKDMSKRCDLPRFRTSTIDEAIWGTIASWLQQPREKILTILRGHTTEAQNEAQTWLKDIERYQAQLTALDAADVTVQEELESGMITPTAYREGNARRMVKRRTLQEQLKTARAAMEGAGASAGMAGQLEAAVDEIRELARTADFQERKMLVRQLVPRGTLKFDDKGAQFEVRFKVASEREEAAPAHQPVILRVVA